MVSPDILIVEDNAAHAELIGRAFEPDDFFQLRLAPSLREARVAIEESRPGLVITDLLLPDGRGTELLPANGTADFPVVVMTGQGDEKMAVEAMKAGAVDYFVKSPQAIAELPRVAVSTLREWKHIVERRRAETALLAS
ncbi:MAG: response regulator, partial [Acidobacteriota bacterium]